MSKNLLLRIGLTSILCLVAAHTHCWAQLDFGFIALQGLPAATEQAQTDMGSDAYPVLIASTGTLELEQLPLPLEFNLNNGKATVWMYVFYSPSSEEFGTYIVARILTYQVFQLGALPFPIPGELVNEVNTNGNYADSDDMIGRLKMDTAFIKYRSDLPNAQPGFVTFGQLLPEGAPELPNDFPLGQSTWTLSFQGGGDSTMTCFVASETGETFCRRIYGLPTVSVPNESTAAHNAQLSVAPNPASGSVTVHVSGVPNSVLTTSKLLLYNQAGELVLDLTESFSSNGYSRASFAVNALPSGLYHCRLVGANVEEHIGLIVVE